MRVLLVSWEYPPLVYGGLGRHVHGLAEALAAAGHEVTVVTQAAAAADDVVNGVRVLRTPPDPPATDVAVDSAGDLVSWVLALNTALARVAAAAMADRPPEVVHAHDWVAAHAGIHLARAFDVPLVVTIHATEAGLWDGWLSTALSRARHDVEGWLLTEATRTVVCSEAMRAEVSIAFDIGVSPVSTADDEILRVVPNGVDAQRWRDPPGAHTIRATLGLHPTAPLLVLTGRLEWEKGGLVAVEALRLVRRTHPGTQLVLAGAGSQPDALRELARRRRLARSVHLVGRLDDAQLTALVAAADVALVPSSYEPFGMVALEAHAAGTPVVASDTGGLREIVTHELSGLIVAPRSPAALAEAVVRLLDEPALGEKLAAAAATQLADRFTWPIVAEQTVAVYATALEAPRPLRVCPAPALDGNVLTGRPESLRRRWRDIRGG